MGIWQGVAMDSRAHHALPFYGRETPETALQPFQGWPAGSMGSLRPSPTLLDTPRRTPLDLCQ
jgi:hypothetical protein